jgi:hypothetical protein
MTESGRRLSSWKEIASHFGRDVRTVMRWEKERALPIQRGRNGKTGVIFADTAELDAWARGGLTAVPPAPDARPLIPVAGAATRRWGAGAVIVVALTVGLGGWRLGGSRTSEDPGSVVMTSDAVIARNPDGTEKWRYEFAGETSAPPFGRIGNLTEPLAGGGFLAATSHTLRRDNLGIRSGQVMWFDPAGRLKQSFSFEDRLRIGSRDYSAPWSLSDYQLHGTGTARSIAVAAHHYEWWPSIITVLDDRWLRKGSFVHAGWVEQVRWLWDDRLAVAGFSNLKDAGMVALLDVNAMDGQSPSPPNSEFNCAGCGPDRPMRYVTFPRSEVNRVSASPFNRASISVREGTLLVRTAELAHTATLAPADALYEFTPQLDLVHASYTDRYWEAHLELQRVGKLTHSRDQCPDRDGPRQIEIWNPATGWTVQIVRRTISR